MATVAQPKAAADAIKAEANVLYQARQFQEAYAKYSEAIDLDDTNAIFFANRAACSLELNDHLNAACDARKATNLDPKYVKAWARLGKALQAFGAYDQSVVAWQSALACCSKDVSEMSAVEKQIKASCEASLRQAKKDLKENPDPLAQGGLNEHQVSLDKSALDRGLMPWQVAERSMEANFKGFDVGQSSGWLILHAHREFERGSKKMYQTTRTAEGAMSGPLGAIECISNGLLRDKRAFIPTTPDWVDIYFKQRKSLKREAKFYGAWLESEIGAAEVQKNALALQKKSGFEASRNALSITIRAWFMFAFFAENMSGKLNTAIQYYRNILAVLEWGIKTWKGVPDAERGVIFSDTFVRGIRRNYLKVYSLQCQRTNYRPGPGLSPEELDRLAEELIKETKENMPELHEQFMRRLDPGFFPAFYLYPIADAYGIRGAIAYASGIACKEASPEQANEYFDQSKAHFSLAAKLLVLPDDEKDRLAYHKMELNACWNRGDSIRTCLACVETMNADMHQLEVSKIWKHSSFRKDTTAALAEALAFRRRAYMGIVQGEFHLESPASVINQFA